MSNLPTLETQTYTKDRRSRGLAFALAESYVMLIKAIIAYEIDTGTQVDITKAITTSLDETRRYLSLCIKHNEEQELVGILKQFKEELTENVIILQEVLAVQTDLPESAHAIYKCLIEDDDFFGRGAASLTAKRLMDKLKNDDEV